MAKPRKRKCPMDEAQFMQIKQLLRSNGGLTTEQIGRLVDNNAHGVSRGTVENVSRVNSFEEYKQLTRKYYQTRKAKEQDEQKKQISFDEFDRAMKPGQVSPLQIVKASEMKSPTYAEELLAEISDRLGKLNDTNSKLLRAMESLNAVWNS